MSVRPGPAWALAALLVLLAVPAWGLPRIEVKAFSAPMALETEMIVRRTAPRLADWLGAEPARLRVEVPAGRSEFNARVRELGGPNWAAGLALPGRNLIVVRSPGQLTRPEDFDSLLIHELTHLYLDTALKGRDAPVWLQEGLAMYASGEGGWALGATMARAVLGEGLEPLSALARSFPSQAGRAALAYAQSYYFVSFLLNRHGEQVLAKLVTELARDRGMSDAMRRATGRSLGLVEQDFREAMEDRFSWLALLTAGGVIWGLVALVGGVGLVLRRRAHRRRLAALPDPKPSDGRELLDRRRWPPPPRRGPVLSEAGHKTFPGPAAGPREKGLEDNRGEDAAGGDQEIP